MYNYGIICKNNSMILFWIILLIILIFIFLNKRVKFTIDYSFVNFDYYFCISTHYFFDIGTLYKEDILKLIQKRKKASKGASKEATKEAIKEAQTKGAKTTKVKSQEEIKQARKRKLQDTVKKLSLVRNYIYIEKTKIKISLGMQDNFVTSMAVPLVSTVLAIGLQVGMPEAFKSFEVKPVQDCFFFSLKGTTTCSIPLKDIFKIGILLWKA